MFNPKDHWTLKTGYFEDPTPTRSLGKWIGQFILDPLQTPQLRPQKKHTPSSLILYPHQTPFKFLPKSHEKVAPPIKMLAASKNLGKLRAYSCNLNVSGILRDTSLTITIIPSNQPAVWLL